MKRNIPVSIAVLGIAVVLALVSWFVLPADVMVQLSAQGQMANTTAKPVAIGVPLALAVLGSVLSIKASEEKIMKSFVMAVIGIVLMVFTLVIN
ncbi:MAG: hypothetical protein Q4C42_08555 [Clostridia bacterium]|nr:hypothetical protein [Clostridia bacterium]